MDDEKITTQDLYGSSSAQAPIPVEETPEIPMDTEPETPVQTSPQVPPPPPMPKVSRGSTVITIVVFLILFVAGIALSSYIRPFITTDVGKVINTQTARATPTNVVATPTPVDPFAGWKTSMSAGFSYKLPPDVLAPTCNGTSCVSQWTDLPGGTRLTISSKTVSKSLSSLRGALITDASGISFTSHDATVSGHTAIEYTGAFTGRTTEGSGFTQMHGLMIEVTPTVTLEINHFTPTGVLADWARDDALFSQIISTLTFTPVPSIATTTPKPATASGY